MLEDLKKKKKFVGSRQTLSAIENGTAKVVYIARDAEERVTGNLIKQCQARSIEIVYVDTMKQLGKACGVDVGAAAAAVLE